jgi:hypothetical protein
MPFRARVAHLIERDWGSGGHPGEISNPVSSSPAQIAQPLIPVGFLAWQRAVATVNGQSVLSDDA